jgi:hypothetical protein
MNDERRDRAKDRKPTLTLKTLGERIEVEPALSLSAPRKPTPIVTESTRLKPIHP